MFIHVRGLVIHAQGIKSGVVNLVVRTQDKDSSSLGRFRQHLANALFRAGDLCNPGDHHSPLRIVQLMVPADTANNLLANGRNDDITEVLPLHLPNGDAYYNALLLHEGVKGHQQCGLFALWHRFRRQKRTDDVHLIPLSQTSFQEQFTGKPISIQPE